MLVRLRLRLRRGRQQERHGDEADEHQDGDAVERPAPGDAAQGAAEQRADGDAQTEGGLEEDHGPADAAAGCGDDGGEGGGDEERVAQAPAGAQADDRTDGAGRAGERGEDDDEDEAGQEGALRADAARDGAGDEHRDARDGEVAREQQQDVALRGVEVLRDGGRIGSTRPRPMNETTAAKATAQTARGWSKKRPSEGVRQEEVLSLTGRGVLRARRRPSTVPRLPASCK